MKPAEERGDGRAGGQHWRMSDSIRTLEVINKRETGTLRWVEQKKGEKTSAVFFVLVKMKPAEANVEREGLKLFFSSLFFPLSYLLLFFSSQHACYCLQPRVHSQPDYKLQRRRPVERTVSPGFSGCKWLLFPEQKQLLDMFGNGGGWVSHANANGLNETFRVNSSLTSMVLPEVL